jgi:hypothetical protein
MTDTGMQPKYKVGPTMKTQPDRVPPPLPPVQIALPERNAPWHPMDSLPKDHVDRAKVGYVYLRGDPYAQREGIDEVEREFYWYVTRQYRKGSWQQIGWFRRRFGPATPPGFEPTGWRKVSEGYPTDGPL